MRTDTKRMMTVGGELAERLRTIRKRMFWKDERQSRKKIEIESKFK
ncbi:hypothetical protein [Arenibacter sp. GZD-96]|nr:hypothetical protein [Arenibacter sp. GZD-96]